MRGTIVLGFILGVAMGCGKRDARFEQSPAIVAIEAQGNDLVFIDRQADIAHLVDVVDSPLEAKAKRLELPAGPSLAVSRRNSRELLVLSEGESDKQGEMLEAPQLSVLDSRKVDRRYGIGSPFARLTQSSDGKHAVLWEVSDSAQEKDLLTNTIRVAAVDLSAAPGKTNPVGRTLRSLGGSIQGVYITPPIVIDGTPRNLALFVFPQGLSLWDLSHPERVEITIEMTLANGVGLMQRRTAVDSQHGRIYFLPESSRDVYVINLGEPKAEADNDFAPTLSQLQLGSGLARDIQLFGSENEPWLAAVAEGQLILVPFESNRIEPVMLQQRGDFLLTFEGKSPRVDEIQTRALVYGEGETLVTFADLEQIEANGARAIETLPLGHPVTSVTLLAENRVLVRFSDATIGVLGLEDRRFQPIQSQQQGVEAVIDPELQRVWTWVTGDRRLGYFDAATLEMDTVWTDIPLDGFFLVGKGTQQKAVALHAGVEGRLTIMNAKNPTRRDAKMLDGFLLDAWVDR